MLKSLSGGACCPALARTLRVVAHNPPIKEELAAIEQAELTNQAKLSRYTWQEIQIRFLVNAEAVD